MDASQDTFWKVVWRKFYSRWLGRSALYVVIIFCLVGVYAPFLASSKPIFVVYDGEAYFPLFRYLLYTGFYTKYLDIFFNLMIFTLPLFLVAVWMLKGRTRKLACAIVIACQIAAFAYIVFLPPKDPAANPELTAQFEKALSKQPFQPDWNFHLRYMTSYARLNQLVHFRLMQEQQENLLPYLKAFTKATGEKEIPTLWQEEQNEVNNNMQRYREIMQSHPSDSKEYLEAQAWLTYFKQRQEWLQKESTRLQFLIMPLLSHFHWEDDAGGQQALNEIVPWWNLTRTNRKDLLSALIFGVRISLVVGIASVALALLIGIPVGAFAGYYGGTPDIIVCRLLEIWEAMPTFFMLLMVVGILQSKSIFLVIAIIGLFGWTGFSRYVRGEFFKQRNLAYVEACRAQGFRDYYIMFKHILPNAIQPVITLAPFAIMGAITAEAGLSFLGLGEENSCSWGVLMDEGRNAFPQESYLLWPPAILLTILLIAIAIVGDTLRDTLDPKLHAITETVEPVPKLEEAKG